jgi:hypothetical protein
MPAEALRISTDQQCWFMMLDDDTLPFLPGISRFLAGFVDPWHTQYFMHSPGERRSGVRLGNGGGGMIISRKLVENSYHTLPGCVSRPRRRGFKNGDVRLDDCLRKFSWEMPRFIYGMWHLDPKVLGGDLTGLVEGAMTRYGMLTVHHLNKGDFSLMPKTFTIQLNDSAYHAVRVSMKASGVLEANHLARFVTKIGNSFAILNEGFSLVVFPEYATLEDLLVYLLGVEMTFWSPENLFDEVKDFLVPSNVQVKRLYLVNITKNGDEIVEEYAMAENAKRVMEVMRKGEHVAISEARIINVFEIGEKM